MEHRGRAQADEVQAGDVGVLVQLGMALGGIIATSSSASSSNSNNLLKDMM